MSKQFELRLIDGNAPAGELEAEDLIAIVRSLKDVAVKLGRVETAAQAVGRPPRRTQQAARLAVGLAQGSTRVLIRRVDECSLPIEMPYDSAIDEKFQEIIESIAADRRPAWVSDTLAGAANDLRSALAAAAPLVEFSADGEVRSVFRTKETRKETWQANHSSPYHQEPITFIGLLRAVNLDTHRLQVTDDRGNKVALPNVADDALIGPLLGSYVKVVGVPSFDASGKLSQLNDVVIEPDAPLPAGITKDARKRTTLEEILAAAPGPSPSGLADLTDEETLSFLTAIGL